jgi:hypothetical protein
MVQAVIRHPLNASTRVPTRDIGFWWTKWHLGVISFPLSLSFHQYSIVCPSLKLLLTEGHRGQSWGPPNKSYALPKIGESQGIKITPYLFQGTFTFLLRAASWQSVCVKKKVLRPDIATEVFLVFRQILRRFPVYLCQNLTLVLELETYVTSTNAVCYRPISFLLSFT